MARELYSLIMNPRKNPLAALPRTVAFQLMTSLAWLWSLVFSFWIGSMAIFGPSAAVHVILLIGIFFTADIFAKARKQKVVSYDMLFTDRPDGCARFDDVWGTP
jgi:hypothetical protein